MGALVFLGLFLNKVEYFIEISEKVKVGEVFSGVSGFGSSTKYIDLSRHLPPRVNLKVHPYILRRVGM
jgi:hypothetical protein